jgi:hypothetical protein
MFLFGSVWVMSIPFRPDIIDNQFIAFNRLHSNSSRFPIPSLVNDVEQLSKLIFSHGKPM